MATIRTRDRAQEELRTHSGDTRFQHELKEMQETQDLREVDDDVEAVATLYEWYAPEHSHRPKSQAWFIALAISATIIVGVLLLLSNFIAAITTAFVAGLIYFIAQKEPATLRYRIMVDGVAIGNTLYHFKDIDAFNVVYNPGQTKTVIIRSKRQFAPLFHLELGEANPVEIRDVLLEFAREDQDLEEPFIDILARRLGF